MTRPRIVVPGATIATTRRTTMRKAFLGPWDPMVVQIWLYALGDAAREAEVDVHHSTLNITHHHTSSTPKKDNISEFLGRLHRDVSCALQVLLRKRGYDVPGELFDDRSTHLMRLVDAEAQASHLTYERLNPVAAGLVQRPEDMPMRTLGFDLWKIGYIEVERPPVYFGSDRPKVIRLELTPPPLLYLAFDGDVEQLVYHMNGLTEDGIRALRDARTRPVMGAKAVRRIHPWREPTTLREERGQRVPSFKIGAHGMAGARQRIVAANEVHAFAQDHREARIARRNGDFERRFPYGTYAMRVHHGAPVEEAPAEDAIVAAPGLTLDEVKAMLANQRVDRDEARGRRHGIVDEVRAALTDEAADILEASALEYTQRSAPDSRRTSEREDGGTPAARHTGTETTGERDVLIEHTRFNPPSVHNARRIVTLRDRRRGRPSRDRGDRHGSDPPD